MHPITVLWAIPRSTSTAFEWMMRQRGDMTCFHEPFGEAWYQGENPLWPRATEDSVRTPGLTLEGVFETLKDAAAKGPVFSKDFPHYVEHMWDDNANGVQDPGEVGLPTRIRANPEPPGPAKRSVYG